MDKLHKKSIFIFRRDLRLEDNTGLAAALTNSDKVVPCFIFDPRQYKTNQYFSPFSFKFLLQSLLELDEELNRKGSRLYFFEGEHEKVIERLIISERIEAVFFNRDYTPFSRERDKKINKICSLNGISAHQYADSLLNEPEVAKKEDNTPYTVFTPYYRKNSQRPVKLPSKLNLFNFYSGDIKSERSSILQDFLREYNVEFTYKGGRKAGLKIISTIDNLSAYSEVRDFPVKDATTHLSAHNKFGTVSIREVYAAFIKRLGLSNALVRQLYWRDFFTHIAFFFPYVFGGSFHKKYDRITWENNQNKFAAWCEGQTGFPIVDAAMNELNQSGFMHNRARMITASFLVKDLHIDWRWGEKYFAQKLVDYDPAVNNGSWQWAASTGCDAQPYFRIFNPWLQQQKFDAECLYIKKWLPHLQEVNPKTLHNLFKNNESIANYPEPIVNHTEASSLAKEMYEDC